MLIVNGETLEVDTPVLLSDFLVQQEFRTDRIAVEKNGSIIPKSDYNSCQLNDGDHLEVITFVGGG